MDKTNNQKRNIVIGMMLLAILVGIVGWYISPKNNVFTKNEDDYGINKSASMDEKPRKSEVEEVKNNTKPSNTGTIKTGGESGTGSKPGTGGVGGEGSNPS